MTMMDYDFFSNLKIVRFCELSIIVHHKIKIIIVQKMSGLWLQGMTMKTMIFYLEVSWWFF